MPRHRFNPRKPSIPPGLYDGRLPGGWINIYELAALIGYRLESIQRILSRKLDPYFPKPVLIKRTRIWSKAGIKAWMKARDTQPELGPEGWLNEYKKLEYEIEPILKSLDASIFEIDLSRVRMDSRNDDLPRKLTVVLGGPKDRYQLYVTPDLDYSLRKLPRFATIPLNQPIGFDLEMFPVDAMLTRLT